MLQKSKKTDTPRGVSSAGGSESGPSPALRDQAVSSDRNTGDPADKQPRHKAQRDAKKRPS